MFKRNKRIINRAFQLRTIFSIIGIAVLTTAVAIGMVGINVVANSGRIARGITDLERVISEETKIIDSFIDSPDGVGADESKSESQVILEDHRRSMETVQTSINFFRDLLRQNYLLLIIIVSVIVAQGIILFMYLIRLTHRISGPIFVISRYMQDIIDGREPKLRALRKNDEFKELNDKFIEMVNRNRKTGRRSPRKK